MNKAASDEPLFILRAKDPLAAQTVRLWAAMAAGHPTHDGEKVSSAMAVAECMAEWRQRNVPQPISERNTAGTALGGSARVAR